MSPVVLWPEVGITGAAPPEVTVPVGEPVVPLPEAGIAAVGVGSGVGVGVGAGVGVASTGTVTSASPVIVLPKLLENTA